MSKELTTFDYDGIDKETRGKLVALAGQFNSQMKGYKKLWMDLGKIVGEAHELLAGNGSEGKFGPWVEANLNVNRSTAYRYMWAWDRFGKCCSVQHFTTEALYELSGPNVPEKAVSEAIKRADKGERITKSLAGELTDKHTVEPDEPATKKLRTQSDEAPTPAEDEPDEDPCDPGKLFSKLLEHLRLATLLLDEINRAVPNQKYRQDAFDSLECANQEILKWRKQSKR